eukprot:7723263-Pyramimonas_sp.AAC.1
MLQPHWVTEHLSFQNCWALASTTRSLFWNATLSRSEGCWSVSTLELSRETSFIPRNFNFNPGPGRLVCNTVLPLDIC